MSVTASVLILSPDPKLAEEARLAFEGIGNEAPRYRVVQRANGTLPLHGRAKQLVGVAAAGACFGSTAGGSVGAVAAAD